MAACKQKHFETTKELIAHLEDWYNNQKGNSVQLDGATKYTSNKNKWITFVYMGIKTY